MNITELQVIETETTYDNDNIDLYDDNDDVSDDYPQVEENQ